MDAEITPTPDGPLHAERIGALKNDRGETIEQGESISSLPLRGVEEQAVL